MLQIGTMQAQNQRLLSHCNALERQKSMLLSQVGRAPTPCLALGLFPLHHVLDACSGTALASAACGLQIRWSSCAPSMSTRFKLRFRGM